MEKNRKPRKKTPKSDAVGIISLCEEGNTTQREIAEMYGISQSAVSRISRGERHAALPRKFLMGYDWGVK